jgi:hypothetical protein
MRKVILILILLLNYACNSQNNQKIDITGNWYEDLKKSNASTGSYSYVEIFIDDESFYMYYDVAGFGSHLDYVIENNIFYYVFSDTIKKKKGIIKFIDENTISIGNGGIILKRISEGLKLEDMLRKNKPKSDYLKFFNQRKAIWKKAHNKE